MRSWPRTNRGVLDACRAEGIEINEYAAGRISAAISADGVAHYLGLKMVHMPRFGKFSAKRNGRRKR